DREPPAGYRAEWAHYLAQPPKKTEVTTDSAMVFRIGSEWLGLPAAWVGEVAPLRPIHSLPHRRGGALAGIVNIRGELLSCFAIERVLGIEATSPASASRRLVVAGQGARRLVFCADEIFGVLHYDAARRLAAPGQPALVKHLLAWNDRTVGLLEIESLWAALERSLA
ncbi:MAG: chemotaxis protein CheW, partial [Rariglobus sp.]